MDNSGKNNLELKLKEGETEGEGLKSALEKLYSDLFIEIDSELIKNEEIMSLKFITALDKTSHKLFVEDIKYYTKDDFADVLAEAYKESKESKESRYSTKDVNATCSGGELDGEKGTFKENFAGFRKLAKWSQDCLDGGGCVNVCRTSLVIDFE